MYEYRAFNLDFAHIHMSLFSLLVGLTPKCHTWCMELLYLQKNTKKKRKNMIHTYV